MLSRISTRFPAHIPLLNRSFSSACPLKARIQTIMQDIRQMGGERLDLKKKKAYLYRRWELEQPYYSREKELDQILTKYHEIDSKALAISLDIYSKKDTLKHIFQKTVSQINNLEQNLIKDLPYDHHQAQKLQKEKNLVAAAILEIDKLNDAHFSRHVPEYNMNDPDLIALLPGINPPKSSSSMSNLIVAKEKSPSAAKWEQEHSRSTRPFGQIGMG